MSNPLEQIGWGVNTQIRQIWEGLQWQLIQWFERSPSSHPTPGWTGWVPVVLWWIKALGIVLLAIALYLLGQRLWLTWTKWINSRTRKASGLQNQGQILRSRSEWLALAYQAQQGHDYQGAVLAIYQALLLLLHDTETLPQDLTRTDREYIRGLDQLWSLSDKPVSLREDWVTVFDTHEDLCFSGVESDRDPAAPDWSMRFNQCLDAYNNLVPYLDQSRET